MPADRLLMADVEIVELGAVIVADEARGLLETFCHDRRAFLLQAGTITPKGTIPQKCYRSFDSLTYANGDIYASCSGGTLWKTEGQAWRPIAPPKTLREIPAISFADGCLFVASGRSVWRRCDH